MDKIKQLENVKKVIVLDDEEIFLDAWKLQLDTDGIEASVYNDLYKFEDFLKASSQDFSESLLILDRFFDEEGLDAIENNLPGRFRALSFNGLIVLCSSLQSIDQGSQSQIDGVIGKLPENWASVCSTIRPQL